MFIPGGLTSLLAKYGYWAIAGVVGLESMGIPLPGEATLIAAGIYAGSTRTLNIWIVIATASAGAILGDNIGFCIGRELGFRLLLRYGRYVGLTEIRIKLGQYLFQRHGGKIVFFGRFIALFRVLAALLAGVNQMSWPRFLLFNAAGAVLWATVYGFGAYYLGESLKQLTKPAAISLATAGVMAIFVTLYYLHRHQSELEAEAGRAIPGPPGRRRRGTERKVTRALS
jgi:membrane protein DedA with SNARE-associated domain